MMEYKQYEPVYAYRDCMEKHKGYFQAISDYFKRIGCGDGDVAWEVKFPDYDIDSHESRQIAAIVAMMTWKANLPDEYGPEDIEEYSAWCETLNAATGITENLTIKVLAKALNIDDKKLWWLCASPEDYVVEGSITITDRYMSNDSEESSQSL